MHFCRSIFVPLAFVLSFSFACKNRVTADDQDSDVKASNTSSAPQKARIYQLLVGAFGATGRASNGSQHGKFSDINTHVISGLKQIGFDTIYLLGVHDTGLGHDFNGDGVANRSDLPWAVGSLGSPFAIYDYKAVSPVLGSLAEFDQLVARIHAAGMRVIIDLVPNHTAFLVVNGKWIGHRQFKFDPSDGKDGRDGGDNYEGTGNQPLHGNGGSLVWNDTALLDMKSNDAKNIKNPASTYSIFRDIVHFWLDRKIDGFRVDTAHMVPVDFSSFIVSDARRYAKRPLYFLAEGLAHGFGAPEVESIMSDMPGAGYDATYNYPQYDYISRVDGFRDKFWAISAASSDLAVGRWYYDPQNPPAGSYGQGNKPVDADHLLFYQSNQDVAEPASKFYNNLGRPDIFGPRVTTAVSSLLSRGQVLMFMGHELGAEGTDQFDGHISIQDYDYSPQIVAWRNGTLDPQRQALRRYYGRLLKLVSEDAVQSGQVFHLREVNRAPHDPDVGTDSSFNSPGSNYDHRITSFVRAGSKTRAALVTVANFDRNFGYNFRLHFTAESLNAMGIKADATRYTFKDRLNTETNDGAPKRPFEVSISGQDLKAHGLPVSVPTQTALALDVH